MVENRDKTRMVNKGLVLKDYCEGIGAKGLMRKDYCERTGAKGTARKNGARTITSTIKE